MVSSTVLSTRIDAIAGRTTMVACRPELAGYRGLNSAQASKALNHKLIAWEPVIRARTTGDKRSLRLHRRLGGFAAG